MSVPVSKTEAALVAFMTYSQKSNGVPSGPFCCESESVSVVADSLQPVDYIVHGIF